MNKYKVSKEEKEYLSEYDISAFERPSIAADIAIFSILSDGSKDDIRKLERKSLKVLLVKRASYPYKDCWALPGGFCRPDEDVKDTAKRELYEETNVENAYLKLVGVYGERDRDPRGWIISNTFMALMDGEQCDLRAGSDAWEAQWFSVEPEYREIKRKSSSDNIFVETEYVLNLKNQETDEALSAVVREEKVFEKYHERVEYELVRSDGIAFDHGMIILNALQTLRRTVKHDFRQAFDLMPELFTLTELQHAFEMVLLEKLVTANFRRKIADYVIETEQVVEGVGYRPAKLFKRNVKAFYQ